MGKGICLPLIYDQKLDKQKNQAKKNLGFEMKWLFFHQLESLRNQGSTENKSPGYKKEHRISNPGYIYIPEKSQEFWWILTPVNLRRKANDFVFINRNL